MLLAQQMSRLWRSSSPLIHSMPFSTLFCASPRQISVGDAGYMVLPPLPSEDDPPLNYIDDGSHGVDFVLNLQDPNIAFGTVQLCAGPTSAWLCAGMLQPSMFGLHLQLLCIARSQAEGTLHVKQRGPCMLHREVLEECCACASTCSLKRQPPAMSHCTA